MFDIPDQRHSFLSQDPANTNMSELIDLHHYMMYVLIFIVFFVFYILLYIIFHSTNIFMFKSLAGLTLIKFPKPKPFLMTDFLTERDHLFLNYGLYSKIFSKSAKFKHHSSLEVI